MFLRPDTLKGDKKKIYVAFKVLKYVMDVDVTSYMVRSNYLIFHFNFNISFQIKWSIDDKLLHTGEIIENFYGAINRVLEHQCLRDDFREQLLKMMLQILVLKSLPCHTFNLTTYSFVFKVFL